MQPAAAAAGFQSAPNGFSLTCRCSSLGATPCTALKQREKWNGSAKPTRSPASFTMQPLSMRNPAARFIFLSSGTWSLVGFESDTPVLGVDALNARVSNERTGAGRYRPLTNMTGFWLLEGVLNSFWLLEGVLNSFSRRPANEGAVVGNIARQLIALGAVENLSAFRQDFGRSLRRQVHHPRSA